MREVQLANLRKWATLTIQIGVDLKAPTKQKQRYYNALMALTDPQHQRIDSNLWKLLSRARKEVQCARQATRATRSSQANGSSSATQAPPTSHTHPNTPNHTALPQTRTLTQPPIDQLTEARRIWADLNDNLALATPEGDLTPPPKMIQHTPFTNSSTVDGQPEQSNNTKQWTARARWMDGQSKVTTQKLTENLASQEQ